MASQQTNLLNDQAIHLSVPDLTGNELEYIKQAIESSWISTQGPMVREFEEKFARFLNVNDAVATVNGTAALHLALRLLDIQQGDEVLVPSLTFIATVNAIRYCNATPVFVDSERETWGMDPEKMHRKITEKTKAVMVTHLYGHPARMREILEIARAHGLRVIEDASHALGSKAYDRMCGTFGDVGCFSFNTNKLITTGGGGMLVSNCRSLCEKGRFLVNQAKGDNGEYFHSDIGYNYRMVNVLAAIGLAQLERIEHFITQKRNVAQLYKKLLEEVNPEIEFSPEQEWALNNFWMSSILVEDGTTRRSLIEFFEENKITARPFFTPIHLLPPYKDFDGRDIEVCPELYERGVNLPCSVNITTEEVHTTADAIREFYAKGGIG